MTSAVFVASRASRPDMPVRRDSAAVVSRPLSVAMTPTSTACATAKEARNLAISERPAFAPLDVHCSARRRGIEAARSAASASLSFEASDDSMGIIVLERSIRCQEQMFVKSRKHTVE